VTEETADKPIKSIDDLIRALDVFPINQTPVRGVSLFKHADGSPRRLVVSFGGYEPPIRPEL